MKKILFLTGTRADYGKIKSLMKQVDNSEEFELNIFVTGMHMLSKYGLTWKELVKDGFENIYKYINQQPNSHMDLALSNTILGLSNYVHEMKPDLIVIHGDRLEALAGAIVGAFNNIKVVHIEGGEVSGTIDESIRHAITKFSHIHLVSNEEAKKRVVQLGEHEENIFIIGSPDIDIMLSDELPTIEQAKERYEIEFENYSIVMFHPVTTEVDQLQSNVKNLMDALIESNENYIVVYPNNDEGTAIILNEFKRIENDSRFKIFPSVRFEYFLTLLKHSDLMVGNSSAGVRETGIYGIPSIDIGNRQKNRYDLNTSKNIIHVDGERDEILAAIEKASKLTIEPYALFGDGKSDEKFIKILKEYQIWDLVIQKSFIDVEY
ncbi:UDP-N-acetylglucosamine 2-epimerase (hydrolyzing) [Bacillus hwajinpoensis]|uniref:UDP-N-acetylglucosamine 2-epimerase (Hydrolyzing) n=1 Tax=Guptibacillus hwajinpoensis TaxID=208199 RepID=A0A845EVV4_9BACL|nr:UDP-N-acetylglucosamine 2-epimerase [Pseudalkalibacillus hwajinpoensis]MYL62245.1 UDP-N-acetylglucosamine 2-epimerase (hydrolyzing) [Pseudalkalibacillus hwajinpoensis]